MVRHPGTLHSKVLLYCGSQSGTEGKKVDLKYNSPLVNSVLGLHDREERWTQQCSPTSISWFTSDTPTRALPHNYVGPVSSLFLGHPITRHH